MNNNSGDGTLPEETPTTATAARIDRLDRLATRQLERLPKLPFRDRLTIGICILSRIIDEVDGSQQLALLDHTTAGMREWIIAETGTSGS